VALSTDKRSAEQERVRIITERDRNAAGLGILDSQDRSLRELLEAYITDLASRTTPSHVYNTRYRTERLLKATGAARVRDLKLLPILQHRSHLVQTGRSHRSANAAVAALSAMLTWAVRMKLIETNPLRDLRRLPETESYLVHVRRALSEEEVTRFLAAGVADDEHQAQRMLATKTIEAGKHGRLYAIQDRRPRVPQSPLWRALLETGARYKEARTLVWSDYDASGPTIHLRGKNTKSRRPRSIPVSATLARELVELRAVQAQALGRPLSEGDRVFLSPWGVPWQATTVVLRRVFDRVLRLSGIPRVTERGKLDIHALRHTAATRFARAGVPLTHTQLILGHSDPKLTARVYTHLQVEDLRSAVDAITWDGRPGAMRIVGSPESPREQDASA